MGPRGLFSFGAAQLWPSHSIVCWRIWRVWRRSQQPNQTEHVSDNDRAQTAARPTRDYRARALYRCHQSNQKASPDEP
jgi:hypothetical protein